MRWPVNDRRDQSRPLVLVSHGTSDPAGQAVVRELASQVRARLPEVDVRLSHVSVESPLIAEVLAELQASDARQAVVVPVLLSVGFHVQVDVTTALAEQPGAISTGALGPDHVLVQVLRQRLAEAGADPADSLVLAVTGSRDESATHAAQRTCDLLGWPGAVVGHLAAGSPSAATAISRLRAARPQARVVAASYLLAPGHFADRLARLDADVISAPLGAHPAIAGLVVAKYRAAAGLP